MFLTARQLEALHRETGANGQLVLPYRARLTPAAQDWVRLKKITLGYSDEQQTAFRGRSQNGASVGATGAGAAKSVDVPSSTKQEPGSSSATGALLWWCDGPCGAAKAAITAQAK